MAESKLLERITVDSEQCGGRPCIRGMRIRVIDVLGLLAAGQTGEEILADFPYLEPDDIDASLRYAVRQMDHPVLDAHPVVHGGLRSASSVPHVMRPRRLDLFRRRL